MNTRAKKLIIMTVWLVGSFNIGYLQAEVTQDGGTLNYDNRAYVHAIHNAPNPAKDTIVEFAKIAYADKAFGQAIYSYPSNVVVQETDFNVEYVDTAYGQAIYSYPNNNPLKHHLELSAGTQNSADQMIVPVVFRSGNISNTTVNP
ncbi:MAG: hypothetical protein IPN42_00380 [Methylococcaceae bacterium]|nr:hypothetical protein [Methylococcaceae bacterium]